jgi:hypothetical protein
MFHIVQSTLPWRTILCELFYLVDNLLAVRAIPNS